jgi:hypothetical protein
METIQCEVLTGDDETVGLINVCNIPRVGEYIWFNQERMGHTSWFVVDVAHWVGNGEGQGYQNVALYVVPTKGWRGTNG